MPQKELEAPLCLLDSNSKPRRNEYFPDLLIIRQTVLPEFGVIGQASNCYNSDYRQWNKIKHNVRLHG